MRLLAAIFLYPLSLLYAMAVAMRNMLYAWGMFKSVTFNLPVITVGNLTVGGTGKTPFTEFLVSLFKDKQVTAVLSRGYKRKTKGFRYVEVTDTVREAGDEPLQIKRKFPKLTVAVEANRVKGIRRLQADAPQLGLVILDDAYQHRRVKPTMSILLVDHSRPITEDHYLPYGRLRDTLGQKHRANVVIVTKCPTNMRPIDQRVMMKTLKLYPYQQLFFTTFGYELPQPVFHGEAALPLSIKETVALTGIASPQPFIEHLGTFSKVLHHLDFPDHHVFTKKDIARMNTLVATYPSVPIFTTEKDAQRLRMDKDCSEALKQQLFYIPVKVQFFSKTDSEKFEAFVTEYIQKDKPKRLFYF
ncbi:MAG: tetraacyldisaccharide 4'-kinase [Bacteroidales bacterium]|nr:tetraacyldisaccharide 4'-kinase [Bacteroidales bacterium]MCL2132963.1 tetraacyldisaccharide 4'-kinase [Bacteroidales bacterium]